MEETSDRMATGCSSRIKQEKRSQRRCSWVCLAILCITTIVVVCLAGGAAFYFQQIAPTSSAENETNV